MMGTLAISDSIYHLWALQQRRYQSRHNLRNWFCRRKLPKGRPRWKWLMKAKVSNCVVTSGQRLMRSIHLLSILSFSSFPRRCNFPGRRCGHYLRCFICWGTFFSNDWFQNSNEVKNPIGWESSGTVGDLRKEREQTAGIQRICGTRRLCRFIK